MQPYKIVYSSKYDKNLSESIGYIVDKFGDYKAAAKLASDIKSAVNARAFMPTSFARIDNQYYVINVRNRQIFYTVNEAQRIMTVEFMYNRGWNGK